MRFLSEINSPADLRQLRVEDLQEVAHDLRVERRAPLSVGIERVLDHVRGKVPVVVPEAPRPVPTPSAEIMRLHSLRVGETGIAAMVSSWQRFAPNTIPAGAKVFVDPTKFQGADGKDFDGLYLMGAIRDRVLRNPEHAAQFFVRGAQRGGPAGRWGRLDRLRPERRGRRGGPRQPDGGLRRPVAAVEGCQGAHAGGHGRGHRLVVRPWTMRSYAHFLRCRFVLSRFMLCQNRS